MASGVYGGLCVPAIGRDSQCCKDDETFERRSKPKIAVTPGNGVGQRGDGGCSSLGTGGGRQVTEEQISSSLSIDSIKSLGFTGKSHNLQLN